MNIQYNISIMLFILAILSIINLIYLSIAFFRNVGFSKYLTRQDINDLYNYNWSDEELMTLGDILIDRKRIAKYIIIFLTTFIFSISLFTFINTAKNKDIDNVEQILQSIYTNDKKDINEALEKTKSYMSDEVYEKLSPMNIDTLQNRYSISNSKNKIRIINVTNVSNNRYIEYQIESEGILISTRRLYIKYLNNKIVEFEEYIMVPTEYVDENKLGSGVSNTFEEEREDNYDKNVKEKLNQNSNDTENNDNTTRGNMTDELTTDDL